MSGLMQPGPTLYRAEEERKKKGSRGLLGEIGEPMSYAPGPVGLLGNAMLGARYLTGEAPLDEGLSAAAIMTGLLQGTKVAPILKVVGKWSENADRLIPRGQVEWREGPLGWSGSVDGKPVATIKKNIAAKSVTGRINGWQWDVTPEMEISRFNQISGDKITSTPSKGFKSVSAAKKEIEEILSNNGGLLGK